jgi:outer membrane protein assembly factor BamB
VGRHDEGFTSRADVNAARTGNVRFKVDTGAFVGTASPVIAASGTIYVGNSAGKLLAIAPDGSISWTATMGPIEGAPAIASDGSIYVASNDGSLRVLSSSGSQIASSLYVDSLTSPLIVDDQGVAYFKAPKEACWAPRGGDVTCDYGAGTFAIADGRLYRVGYLGEIDAYGRSPVDFDAGTPVAQGELGAVGVDGTTYVAANGRLEAHDAFGVFAWACVIPGADSVAVASASSVYVSSGSTLLSCAPGGVAWSVDVGASITTALAIDAAGAVFFGTMDGTFRAYDATGAPVFTVKTGGPVRSSPAIGADGTIYFGSDDGFLYAVGP